MLNNSDISFKRLLSKEVKVVDVTLNAWKVSKQLNAEACAHISRDFLVTGDEIEYILSLAR